MVLIYSYNYFTQTLILPYILDVFMKKVILGKIFIYSNNNIYYTELSD